MQGSAGRIRRVGRAMAAGALLLCLPFPAVGAPDRPRGKARLEHLLDQVARDADPDATLPVIVQTVGKPTEGHFARLHRRGGAVKGLHFSFSGYSANLPAAQVLALADDPEIGHVSLDVPVRAALDVAALAVRADAALVESGGLDGSGIGIAVIDTGVQLHPDLMRLRADLGVTEIEVVGHERGLADYFGHGTAVAGVIGGSGLLSSGAGAYRTFRGLAPGARIYSLRALQPDGSGRTSDVIMAIEWVIAHREKTGIRVINMSLGHPVYESYETDPLCQAAAAAVRAGIVVVASAGNGGRLGSGFGTITSPGNHPDVITVGAMDDSDTAAREDDVLAPYSAKGPTLVDHVVKPDLVAPGAFIVSLRAVDSWIDTRHPEATLRVGEYRSATRLTEDRPGRYTVLTGTSLAASMVSGTAALMLQKDPSLSPATIKARLMASASKDDLMALETGAGYLDVAAALRAEGKADTASSPRASIGPDETVVIEDLSGLWGGEWHQGLIWGLRKAMMNRLLSENDRLTAAGLIWSGNAARVTHEAEFVETLGLVWSGN
jgi:serine protease AprX